MFVSDGKQIIDCRGTVIEKYINNDVGFIALYIRGKGKIEFSSVRNLEAAFGVIESHLSDGANFCDLSEFVGGGDNGN